VPELWKRGYERLRSGNQYAVSCVFVIYFGLLGVAIWYAIQFTKNGQTKWGLAIKLGALAAGLLFLQSLNGMPLWARATALKKRTPVRAYADSPALGIAVFTAFTITIVLPAAEPLYRRSQTKQFETWENVSRGAGFVRKSFFLSGCGDIAGGRAHRPGRAFYIIATHYGAWAPQEVSYSAREYGISVDFRGCDWFARFHERGVHVSGSSRFLFLRATRDLAGSRLLCPHFFGIPAQQLPARTCVHSRRRSGLIGIVAGIVCFGTAFFPR